MTAEFTGKFKFTQFATLERTVLHVQRSVTHPPADSRWFRIRDRVSEWIAPPMPLNTWTDITVNTNGKIRVRAEAPPQSDPGPLIAYDDWPAA